VNTQHVQKSAEQPSPNAQPGAPAPRLSRRSGDAADRVLSRVLPDSGIAKLDVAAFTSSI
jgi:hypothetical protein